MASDDLVERAEAAFNNPLSFGMRALAIELLVALKDARAQRDEFRAQLDWATRNDC